MPQPDETVVVLGAGATAACGGPTTDALLYESCRMQLKQESLIGFFEGFLQSNFNLPVDRALRTKDDYPGLPLLLSLIDTALDRKQQFGTADVATLARVRRGIEYAVFAVLDFKLRGVDASAYRKLIDQVRLTTQKPPQIISTNYDILVDNMLVKAAEGKPIAFPDYGCDVVTPEYRDHAGPDCGTLLKLHGSLNWIYCPGCHALNVSVAESERSLIKAYNAFYSRRSLNAEYEDETARKCESCGARVRPILITPTHRKDYRNPHVAQVWYRAERLLGRAKRLVFVGYSLPDDDVDVIYLLKRAARYVEAENITVVEYVKADEEHQRPMAKNPVGRRYRALFGDAIDWHTHGFGHWIDAVANNEARGLA